MEAIPNPDVPSTAAATHLPDHPLRDAVIWDSGSNCHITNDKSRYSPGPYHEYRTPGTVHYKGDLLNSYGSGTVEVKADYPGGKGIFILREVVYVPDFFTSVISHHRLKKAGYLWDDEGNRIYEQKTRQVIFTTTEFNGHYVV